MAWLAREDSYWSRFTKSGGRERDDAQELPASADAAPDLGSPLGPPPGGGMPRPPVQDVNVTLTRPAPPPPAPPPLAPISNAATEQIETIIGRESAVQGTIRSEHSIRIQGGAQGEIECKRSVFVEEGARVSAKITASEVTISGELDGQVFSSGRVEIRPTGRVLGEINAPSLIMLEGAFFDGQLRMKKPGPAGRLDGTRSRRGARPAAWSTRERWSARRRGGPKRIRELVSPPRAGASQVYAARRLVIAWSGWSSLAWINLLRDPGDGARWSGTSTMARAGRGEDAHEWSSAKPGNWRSCSYW